MKVILTESQLNEILIRESVTAYLDEAFNVGGDFERVKRTFKNALLSGVAVAALLSGIDAARNMNATQKYWLKDFLNKENAILHNDKNALMQAKYQEDLHNAKVEVVKQCMADKMMKLRGPKNYNPNEVKVTPDDFVCAAEEYDYDLVLALAQAWCESHFCTTKRAKSTNSMFSVGCYDNGKNVATYKTPGESIRPYMNLMTTDYDINNNLKGIFNGEKSLVNQNGSRYASDKNYEKTRKSIYNSIIRDYPILSMDVEQYMKGLDINSI